ncbi:hypothetical protein Bca101_025372 [Brassica carinata]
MGNSESRSPNDQVSPSTCSPHEDGCKEAEIKLIECAITLPEVKELATKGLIEAFKDAGLHDKYLENVDEQMSKAAVKELESIFPGESKEWALGVHKYFMKGKGGSFKLFINRDD